MARDKEFTEAERKYYLEDYGEERCNVCDSLRTIYASKYSQNIFGFYCPTCHDWRVSYAPHSYHKELREMFPEVTMFMDIDVLLIV